MSKLVIKGTKEKIEHAIIINGFTHVYCKGQTNCDQCSLIDSCYGFDGSYCAVLGIDNGIFKVEDVELIND